MPDRHERARIQAAQEADRVAKEADKEREKKAAEERERNRDRELGEEFL